MKHNKNRENLQQVCVDYINPVIRNVNDACRHLEQQVEDIQSHIAQFQPVNIRQINACLEQLRIARIEQTTAFNFAKEIQERIELENRSIAQTIAQVNSHIADLYDPARLVKQFEQCQRALLKHRITFDK